MYMKLPIGDLNPGPSLPHPTSTYTCGVTTALRVRGGVNTSARKYNFLRLINYNYDHITMIL